MKSFISSGNFRITFSSIPSGSPTTKSDYETTHGCNEFFRSYDLCRKYSTNNSIHN